MRNRFEIYGNDVLIFLHRKDGTPLATIIELSDLERANEYDGIWISSYDKDIQGYYVRGSGGGPLFHRWIANAPKGMVVDHINHQTLDNRRKNLRVCSNSENQQNRTGPQSNNLSHYRGVSKSGKSKWQASVKINRKYYYLGVYSTPEEAGKVAEIARSKMMPYSKEALQQGGTQCQMK